MDEKKEEEEKEWLKIARRTVVETSVWDVADAGSRPLLESQLDGAEAKFSKSRKFHNPGTFMFSSF